MAAEEPGSILGKLSQAQKLSLVMQQQRTTDAQHTDHYVQKESMRDI